MSVTEIKNKAKKDVGRERDDAFEMEFRAIYRDRRNLKAKLDDLDKKEKALKSFYKDSPNHLPIDENVNSVVYKSANTITGWSPR